jgi:hypothetical protein
MKYTNNHVVLKADAKKHPTNQTAGRKAGLLNAERRLLPEAVLPSDAPYPATANDLHAAYTWERKVQHHGAYGSAMMHAELSTRFPTCM